MSEQVRPSFIPQPIRTSETAKPDCKLADDKVNCERCGTEMFRMHAVWRCPNCRFKTDCCGW
jgi:hypothetical protein